MSETGYADAVSFEAGRHAYVGSATHDTTFDVLNFLSTADTVHMVFAVVVLFFIFLILFVARDIFNRKQTKKQYSGVMSLVNKVYQSTNGIESDASHAYSSLPEMLSAMNKKIESTNEQVVLCRRRLLKIEQMLILLDDRSKR